MSPDELRMKRKLQQLGSSTLAISLPADWIHEQGLEKGDELVIQRDESGGSLLVVPDSPRAEDTAVTIDVGSLDAESIRRAVLAQYVLGRRLVELESNGPFDPAVFDAVEDVERQLIGVGVVEEGVDSLTIRCSVAPGDFEVPTLMERLWRTEATMRSEAVEALLHGDREAAARTHDRNRRIDKLFYLFLRLVFATYRNPGLNRSVGLETGFPLIGYRSVAQDVTLLAEASRRIAQLVVDADYPALDPETAEHFRAVTDALDELTTVVRRAVIEPTGGEAAERCEVLTRFETAADAAQDHLETTRPEPLLVLQRVLTALRRSATHAEDSLDVATHFAYRSTVEGDDR